MIFRRKTSPSDGDQPYDVAEVAEYDDYVDGSLVEAPEHWGSPGDELTHLRTERGALIELCLYARDRVNSPAAAERIDSGLLDLGITTLRPDGQPFDPSQHEAAASVPTDDPALHGTVAETEVPGYADRGQVVRPPVVAVYRRDQS